MLVVAFSLNVEVHLCRIAKALEEVEEHLGWHLAYLLALVFGIPDKPRTASEVERNAAQTIVHW